MTSRESPRLEDIAAAASLGAAWQRVRRNRGCAGGDGVTIDVFAHGLDGRLARLQQSLLEETYRPGRLRRFPVRKHGGGERVLAVPCVADRVAQTAAASILEPWLEGRQALSSHGYRPGRGTLTAIAALVATLARGLDHVVTIDIAAYFDSVPHARLMSELAIWIEDAAVLRLLRLWLRSFSRRGRGLAQGAPISPLLANLYLHPVDRLLEASGFAAIRYADDLVILCKSSAAAEAAHTLVRRLLNARGLAVNANKCAIYPPGASFRYLGAIVATPAAEAQDASGAGASLASKT